MSRLLRPAVLAALLPFVLAACAPSLPRMTSSFDLQPAASVRGEPSPYEEPPSIARVEAPAHQPLPLERGLRCGATPGEQARAQCVRGGTGDLARP